jgi:2-polyprenyl-6-methoxyphenol hydroxylase-like FAD-dependent oxidoreductase
MRRRRLLFSGSREGWPEISVVEHPVLIVGAGPTGLVLAIDLARRGVPCHLVDRRPEPLGRDRAIVVKSRSLEIFQALGLGETFMRRGRIIRGIDLFSGGTKVASVGLEALDSPFPFDLCLPEEETERILTDRLEVLGGRVERGVEFAGLEQDQHGVLARLRSLHDGERTLKASWVIGTDGVHSGVRAAIGDDFEGHDYPTLWGVADAYVAGWARPGDRATVQIEPPVVIAFPLRDGRWRFTFRSDATGDDVLATVGARLRAISPEAALQDPDEPQIFHTHARVARRYRIGRVLLAGDAAHACTPFEGHGMNTGIQDSYNLGWKLALVVTGAAPESLLDSYQAERRPVAQAVARSGDDAEARAAPPNSADREALIRFLASPEGRGAAAIAEAEIAFGYDPSPIVGQVPDTRTAAGGTPVGFRVGDAAPLQRRSGTCRLHQLIDVPDHTLFLMLGEADSSAVDDGLTLAGAIAEHYRPHVQAYVVTRNASIDEDALDKLLGDRSGALHERLGAGQPCLCLVRPDGHLGFRGEPPSLDTLQAHLGRIFRSR